MLLQHTCSSYHRHHGHLIRSHSATKKESESETIGPFSGSRRNIGLLGMALASHHCIITAPKMSFLPIRNR